MTAQIHQTITVVPGVDRKSNRNKLKYKPGDKLGDYTLVKVVSEKWSPAVQRYKRQWEAECACGRRRTISNANLHKLRRCQNCAQYLYKAGRNIRKLRLYQMTTKLAAELQPEQVAEPRMPNHLPDWDGLQG